MGIFVAVLRAALAYFVIVFIAGFVFGTFRTLVLEQWTTQVWATVFEMPLILLVAWVACGRVMNWFRGIDSLPAAFGMGFIALVMLLFAEFVLSVVLFGRSALEHLILYLQPAMLIGLMGQIVFGLFPVLWLRLQSQRRLHAPSTASSPES